MRSTGLCENVLLCVFEKQYNSLNKSTGLVHKESCIVCDSFCGVFFKTSTTVSLPPLRKYSSEDYGTGLVHEKSWIV
jgi:hypothetical protein